MAEEWSHCAKGYSTNCMSEIPLLFADIAAEKLAETVIHPVRFLDVAAGTGALTIKILQKFPKHPTLQTTVTITDFAPGMITEARNKINSETEFQSIRKLFLVMDAQALSFEANTFTHIGCMFGVMFFPDRRKALLEMHRVLQHNGVAVIGTWKHMDMVDIVTDFGQYLQLPHMEKNMAPVAEAVAACSCEDALQEELKVAGFRDVAVTSHEEFLYLPNDLETYNAVIGEAVLGPDGTGPGTAEEMFSQWRAFLSGPQGRQRWVSESDGRIKISFIANIAVAKK